MNYQNMYEELKDILVGQSDNWTHEEIKERAKECIDAFYTLDSAELISDFEDSQIINVLKNSHADEL